MNRRGVTLIEMLTAVAVLAAVGAVLVKLLPLTQTVFTGIQIRQQLNIQSRTCMDTIVRLLRNGRAGTVVISTPTDAPPVIPNSQIKFDLATPNQAGVTGYRFRVSGGSLLMQALPGGQPTALASHVTSLMFSGDSRDPAVINVSLRLDAPWVASGDPSHVLSVILPTQSVRMVSTQ